MCWFICLWVKWSLCLSMVWWLVRVWILLVRVLKVFVSVWVRWRLFMFMLMERSWCRGGMGWVVRRLGWNYVCDGVCGSKVKEEKCWELYCGWIGIGREGEREGGEGVWWWNGRMGVFCLWFFGGRRVLLVVFVGVVLFF